MRVSYLTEDDKLLWQDEVKDGQFYPIPKVKEHVMIVLEMGKDGTVERYAAYWVSGVNYYPGLKVDVYVQGPV